MTERLLDAVTYIVRRIAAADETDGLDREIVDHLLSQGFAHDEIGDAFRFLAAAAAGIVSPVCNNETKGDPPFPSGMPLAPGKS